MVITFWGERKEIIDLWSAKEVGVSVSLVGHSWGLGMMSPKSSG